MKLFVAILALVACVFAEEWTIRTAEQINSIRCDCSEEHNISADQISDVMNFNFSNDTPVPDYICCVYKGLQIFSSGSGWNTTRLAKQYKIGNLQEDEIKQAADGCIAENPKGDRSDASFVRDCLNCIMTSPVGESYKTTLRNAGYEPSPLACD